VTHGGHGTAMRAMRYGVPMVVIPGLAGDQPFVAAAVQEWGAGRALPGDASTDVMRTAAQEVLSIPTFRNAAREKSALLAGIDGAANAANEVEALLASRAQQANFAGAGTRNNQCQQVA
jgi:UDP:flavonoid glycosyltransferase YjiC (YdhE family)